MRFLICFCLLLAPVPWDSAVRAGVPEELPNILFVAVDDLNDWIGPLGGNGQTLTPNFDRLARMGVTFTNAQCAASVCNPSRAALMTGVAPHRSGVYNNFQLFRESPVLREARTIPQYLAEHGYRTTARGKIFHYPTGVFADIGSWQEWVPETGVGQEHPDRTADHLANGLPRLAGHPNNLDWGALDYPKEEMKDYRNAQWAAGLLAREQEEPLFLACGIFRPHLPWYVPGEYFERFAPDGIELPRMEAADLDDVPIEGRFLSGGLDPNSEYERLKRHGLLTEAVRAYLASVAFADDCLGVILDGLERSPQRGNTIVIVWGDHGFHLGEKLHYKKGTLWEESARTPLFLIVPGLTRGGSRVTTPVSLLDIYPTILELCGLPANPGNDGHSLVPLLADPDAPWPHAAVTTLERGYTVRVPGWRYIRYLNGSEELYDHAADPAETVNLAGDPAARGVLEELRALIPGRQVTAIPFHQQEKP